MSSPEEVRSAIQAAVTASIASFSKVLLLLVQTLPSNFNGEDNDSKSVTATDDSVNAADDTNAEADVLDTSK